jgi:hypothetical protein
MRTTINITVEKTNGGHRFKITHEGDQLDRDAGIETFAALRGYWEAIAAYSQSRESVNIMKSKQENITQRINLCVDTIKQFQGEGLIWLEPEFGDDPAYKEVLFYQDGSPRAETFEEAASEEMRWVRLLP